MRTQPAPKSEAVWQMLRAAIRPMTASELAGLNDVSEVRARRALRLWAEAGFLQRVEPETAGRAAAVRYKILPGAPISAPVISATGSVEAREGAMAAGEFAAIRRLAGLDLRAFGRAIGLGGSPNTLSREMRRYETGQRPISEKLAQAARDLAANNEKSPASLS